MKIIEKRINPSRQMKFWVKLKHFYEHGIAELTPKRLWQETVRHDCLFGKDSPALAQGIWLKWRRKSLNSASGRNGNKPFDEAVQIMSIACFIIQHLQDAGLILHAVDWRAPELTEQIDSTPLLHSWASNYRETTDWES